MTASITSLTARRAIQSAERIIESGVRIKMLGSDEFVDNVPVPATLLEQLITLARGTGNADLAPIRALYERTVDAAASGNEPDLLDVFLKLGPLLYPEVSW